MKVAVNEQVQRFPLATEDGWKGAVGHEITVGKYTFCATPLGETIRISEVSTGRRVNDIPITLTILSMTFDKKSTIDYYKNIGEALRVMIDNRTDFDEVIEQMKQETIKLLGKTPPIENINVEEEFEKRGERNRVDQSEG